LKGMVTLSPLVSTSAVGSIFSSETILSD
jgi:hypothetical protein